MPAQINRRKLLRSVAGLTLAASIPGGSWADAPAGPLPVRASGELDIHHIDTGRGNCTLIVGPDGSSVMIDAGASLAPLTTSAELRPSASMRPGQWQARYALYATERATLDYFIATHIHPDHVGDVNASCPLSFSGKYRLSGVSDVDAMMPITTIVDRAFPDYGDTRPAASLCAENYLAFLTERATARRKVEAAEIGSDKQIDLGNGACKLRFLAGNGRVWTGATVRNCRPALASLAPEDRPGENFYSLALRLTYGRFTYFGGGDLTAETYDGRVPWMDIETPTVHAAGRTEVVAADHHGYFDACGPEFVRALNAQAYVIQAWDVGHPGSEQLERMLGAWQGQAQHDVFATRLLPANEVINRRFVPLIKSSGGHVVVRVARGGESYRIFVIDSKVEHGDVLAHFGPYHSRG